MINVIPVIGWILSFVCLTSLSLPFWFCWTHCGLGAYYFGEWLPVRFHAVPFWHIVGLFMCASILKGFVPTIASVSQDNDNKNGKK